MMRHQHVHAMLLPSGHSAAFMSAGPESARTSQSPQLVHLPSQSVPHVRRHSTGRSSTVRSTNPPGFGEDTRVPAWTAQKFALAVQTFMLHINRRAAPVLADVGGDGEVVYTVANGLMLEGIPVVGNHLAFIPVAACRLTLHDKCFSAMTGSKSLDANHE